MTVPYTQAKRSDDRAPTPAALQAAEADDLRKRAYYEAPQRVLIARRFSKHKVALWMAYVVATLYLGCLNANFFSPYDPNAVHRYSVNQPPQSLRFGRVPGFALPRFYVRPLVRRRDPVTLAERYTPDLDRRLPLRFGVRGYSWRFLWLFPTDRHFFGVDPEPVAGVAAAGQPVCRAMPANADMPRRIRLSVADAMESLPWRSGDIIRWSGAEELRSIARLDEEPGVVWLDADAALPPDGEPCEIWRPHRAFLLGTGPLGQDVLSRILHGGRISLLIGLMGVLLSFALGITLGGISGYFGGRVDMIIQRTAEVLMTIPKIPIWLALAAAIPKQWSSLSVYFMMTLILASMGWTGLCRVVRGKLLALREEDYARAALLAGASERRIIFVHLLPNFVSHLIASLTLAIPGMILAETSLSFLGLGLRPPIVSWGVLLQQAQSVEVVENQPWMLLPAVAVIVSVLAFNFVGEGLRDAADPYST